jgi:LPXTG-site transpeptidase (sortase) family protein
MAKRTNKHGKRITKTHHPRPTRRGWLFLVKRWKKLSIEFVSLFKETCHYIWLLVVYFVCKHRATIITIAILITGLLLTSVSMAHWWKNGTQQQAAKKALLAEQLRELPILDLPHPTHIYIQWFVDTAITDGTVLNDNWTLSSDKAIYVISSARPSTNGNIVIYGHNTREVLGNIRALKGYERITLTLSNGEQRIYKVTRMHQVLPTDVSWIQTTTKETLTLFTCAGFADAERFMVQAEPVVSN